ncbi:MAG: hypothetical protein LBJ21_01955, partial [Acidobacteriota bacterium]|nr:hypothetical protein [Acidobacteriota bacterium]
MIYDSPAPPPPQPAGQTAFPVRFCRKCRNFYEKYEKYSATAVFALGFIWDALTLRRIDNIFDNLILLGYLILIGAVIVLNMRFESGAEFPDKLRRAAPRFFWVMQFCFGGLFSSYVVFYFKSASFTRTAFFFLLLVGLLIGNEFLENRLRNRTLLAAFYSFCFFSFLAFFLPILLRDIRPHIFVIAGILSAAASFFVFWLGQGGKIPDLKRAARQAAAPILCVFLFLNVLYFANLIPPVPLALKTGRAYHHVQKTPEGYEVKYAPPSGFYFWRSWDDPFYWTPGESVYCLTSIFAPGGIRVPLRHVWRYKTGAGWITTDTMPFSIDGGRDGGYRWYSRKTNVRPGRW